MQPANMFWTIPLAALALLSVAQLKVSARGVEISAKRVEWPCTDRSAIQWVRDPQDCSQYFICHFGQPLSMPACPYGQVWGNKARNCVPENSRWNDCNKTSTYVVKNRTEPIKSHVTDDQKGYNPVSATSPQTVVVTIQPMQTETEMREVVTTFPPSSPSTSTPQTTLSLSMTRKPKKTTKKTQKKPKKPTMTPAPRQDDLGKFKTKYPTATSPFQPQSPRKYYTYPRYSDITYKPIATTEIPRTETPTKPPMTTTKPEVRPTDPEKPIQPLEMSTGPTVAPTHAPVTLTRPSVVPTQPPMGQPIVSPVTTPEPSQRTTKMHTTTTERTTTMTTTPTSTTTTAIVTPTSAMVTPTRRPVVPVDDGHTTMAPSDWAIKPMQLRLPEGHPCRTRPGQLVAHPTQCHWYFNCTVAALENLGGHLSALEEECRYPQLFDTVTGRCREFINVKCGDRFEPVDPCEYQALQCQGANCVPCHHRYGSCRGKANGIYPFHTERWTPTFITCYQQRNIAQDDCQPPTPIFSPVERDCVALFDVPKEKGGLRPDCSVREDGFYPDEQGRCGIFFECRDGQFAGYDECPSGTVFDPMTLRCQLLDRSSPPCGEGQNPSCSDRHDGFHADPFGRCPYYFECRKNQFVRHLTCDFGSFDPTTQECVIPTELMPRPCGLLPNPCEGKPSGFYPDENSNCRHYVECSRGVMISNGTCPESTVFSSISGRCDRPENAPQPCGLAPSCENRKDGKYAALTRGCSFYFECRRGRFAGLKQCAFEDGGFFFNEKTGRCDFPQNICPPCGYRWWGCPRSTYR